MKVIVLYYTNVKIITTVIQNLNDQKIDTCYREHNVSNLYGPTHADGRESYIIIHVNRVWSGMIIVSSYGQKIICARAEYRVQC